jgi:hypothetical protein
MPDERDEGITESTRIPMPLGATASVRMRSPDSFHGDEIAARRLFARLDESLRVAETAGWSPAVERDPSVPPDVTPDDDDETRPLTPPEAPDAPQPSAPQPQTPQPFPPVPEQQ